MEEDGAIEVEGDALGDTEEDGAIEGDRLELGNVVGFDVGIWEEEGVCVGISPAQSWMSKACTSVDVPASSCRPDSA